MLKAVLIAASMAVAMPCFAQEVRVITGDIEHVYGAGAQVLDDADLQARNQRALERIEAERQLAIERRNADVLHCTQCLERPPLIAAATLE